jgi:hypothetical protein
VWRQVQSLGSQKEYQEDKAFNLSVRKLIAVAFLPILDVVRAFNIFSDEFDDDADQLLDYFESTWIGAPKTRG